MFSTSVGQNQFLLSAQSSENSFLHGPQIQRIYVYIIYIYIYEKNTEFY